MHPCSGRLRVDASMAGDREPAPVPPAAPPRSSLGHRPPGWHREVSGAAAQWEGAVGAGRAAQAGGRQKRRADA